MRNCIKLSDRYCYQGHKSAQSNNQRSKQIAKTNIFKNGHQNLGCLLSNTLEKLPKNQFPNEELLTDDKSTDKSSNSRKNSDAEELKCQCQCHKNCQSSSQKIKVEMKNKLYLLKTQIVALKSLKQQILDEIDLLTMNFSFILELASNNICQFADKKFSETVQSLHRLSEKNTAEEIIHLQNILEVKEKQIGELKDENYCLSVRNGQLSEKMKNLEECLEKSSRKSAMNLKKWQSYNATNCSSSSSFLRNEFHQEAFPFEQNTLIQSKIYRSIYSKQKYGMEDRISTIKNKINQIQQNILKDIRALSHNQK